MAHGALVLIYLFVNVFMNLKYFPYFSQEIGFEISCTLSVSHTIVEWYYRFMFAPTIKRMVESVSVTPVCPSIRPSLSASSISNLHLSFSGRGHLCPLGTFLVL